MKTKLLSFLFLLMIGPSSILAQFAPENFITFRLPRVFEVVPADITGDGYTDFLAIVRDFSENDFRIVSFRNDPNAPGNFSLEIPVDLNADITKAMDVADFNGDGRIDIIRSSVESDKIVWYRNQDGNGNYSPEFLITTVLSNPNDVVPADIDGDGDMDFVACSGLQNKIYWF
jgi:hypothetical protein